MTTAEKITSILPLTEIALPLAWTIEKDEIAQPVESSRQSKNSQMLTTVAPKIIPIQQSPANAAAIIDWFESVMTMIGLLLKMASTDANNQSTISQNQTLFIDKIREAAKAAGDRSIAEETKQIKAQLAAEEAARHASFWQKLIGAIVTVASFVFGGPAIGVLTATLFTLQSFGVTDKIFQNIDSTAGRLAAKICFTVAVAAVCGSIAGFFDGAIANSAEAVVADASGEVGAGVAQSSREMIKSAIWTDVKSFGFQTFVSSGLSNDIATQSAAGIGQILNKCSVGSKDRKEAEQILTLIFNAVAVLIGTILMNGSSSNVSTSLFENLSKAAAKPNSDLTLKVVNGLLNICRNPFLITGSTLTFEGLSTYWQVMESKAKNSEADATKRQGTYDGGYSVLMSLMNTCNQWIQQTAKDNENLLQSVTDHLDFQSFANQGRYIAEIFA